MREFRIRVRSRHRCRLRRIRRWRGYIRRPHQGGFGSRRDRSRGEDHDKVRIIV